VNDPNDIEETIEVPELLEAPAVQEAEVTSPPELSPSPNGAAEILVVPETIAPPIHEIQRRRELARGLIGIILGIAFLATAFWVLATATFAEGTAWANTKEALQILLPVESSLLGAAVVFYFTGNGEQR